MPAVIGPGGRPLNNTASKRKGGFIPSLVKALAREGLPGAQSAAALLAGRGTAKDAKTVAKATTSNLQPVADFVRDPSLLSGVSAAVMLPTLGRSGQFARLMKAANEAQLVGPAKMHGDLLGSLPALGEGMKTKKGRAYSVDLGRASGTRYNDELNRIVAVQDSKTGTMYFAQGGYHHAELERALADRGVKGEWLQHEVFPESTEFGVPSRLNFDVWGNDNAVFGVPGAQDTRAATIARMRLLRQLRKMGVNAAPSTQGNLGRW